MNGTTAKTNRRWYLAGIGVVVIVVAAILMRPALRPSTERNAERASVIAPTPASQQPAVVSTDAKILLDQMRTAYQDLKSAEFVGTVSSNVDADGEQQQSSTEFTSSFALRRVSATRERTTSRRVRMARRCSSSTRRLTSTC